MYDSGFFRNPGSLSIPADHARIVEGLGSDRYFSKTCKLLDYRNEGV